MSGRWNYFISQPWGELKNLHFFQVQDGNERISQGNLLYWEWLVCLYIAMLDSGQVVLAFLSVCILCLMFTSVYRLPVKHSLIQAWGSFCWTSLLCVGEDIWKTVIKNVLQLECAGSKGASHIAYGSPPIFLLGMCILQTWTSRTTPRDSKSHVCQTAAKEWVTTSYNEIL